MVQLWILFSKKLASLDCYGYVKNAHFSIEDIFVFWFLPNKAMKPKGYVVIFDVLKKNESPPSVHSTIHLWLKTTLAAFSNNSVCVYHQNHDVWNWNDFSTANQSAPN